MSADNCVPLLIQQNVDGSNFFNRSWDDFKDGFNDSSGNYWFGNDLLSQLTLNGRYKLRLGLWLTQQIPNILGDVLNELAPSPLNTAPM